MSTNSSSSVNEMKLQEEINAIKLKNLQMIVDLLVKFDCCDEECVSLIKAHTHNLLVQYTQGSRELSLIKN